MSKKKQQHKYPQFDGLDLKPEWEDFVYFYCHPDYNYNATRAYAKAYNLDDIDDYNSASTSASRLLKNVKIMDAVDVERKRRLQSHEDLAEFVLQQWQTMAQSDLTEALNITGPIVMIKDISEIPQHMRSNIKKIETTSNGVKVEFYDKNKALENIARALGMFVEKTQNVNEDYESLVDKIEKKRQAQNAND
jgi:phage terminase small subunit